MTRRDPISRQSGAVWLALAGLVLMQAVVSFHDVWPLHTVYTYDTASYYVVARNLALGRGLTDTNLWHFLGPQTLPHPAGDHWPAGWPVVLGTLMRIFGHSERAALLIMAALSTLLPVGVFALTRVVSGGADVRAPLLASLLVIFEGRLQQTNVTTDVTMPYALGVLGGLVGAFYLTDRTAGTRRRRRAYDALAGVMLTLPIWFRGEAFFLPLAFAPVVLWPRPATGTSSATRVGRLAWMALGAVVVQLSLVTYNLVAFGRVVPVARSLTPWMRTYREVFTFLTDPSPATWWAQGLPQIVFKVSHVLADHGVAFFQQLPWMLPASAAIGAAYAIRRRDARALAVVLFVLFTWIVPCLLVPVIANQDRTVMNATPCFCVLAALSVRPLLDWAKRRLARVEVFVAIGGWALLCCTLTWPLHLRWSGWTQWTPFLQAPADLTDPAMLASLQLRPTDVVLSKQPWQLAAVLDVRTLMWPVDGDAALRAVIARYEPRYVLTRGGEGIPVAAHVKARVGQSVWYELDH
jgi:hypothetical protein